ncbi:unnamed protein product [Dovyalis caffra]|uniref:Early flowering 3 n=1 Tax=Dovyalis caffra TaxID=77055 RepID=A0AAV1SVN3_9ROSI|nr:unnamed protein product [Dovyalis caffra]
MRGAKDGEKMMSPMFPRLHVNDAEKGGPRAPPRNKMALYEQLSIPSQRHSTGSGSTLPFRPNNASTLAPSMSSSHGIGHERSVFTPFSNSPTASHLAEKHFYYSSGVLKSSALTTSQEEKSVKATNDQSLNTTQPLSSSAKCNSFQSHNFSNFKNFSWKKFGDEKDSRFHSSAQSGSNLHRNNSQHSKDQENRHCLNLSFSVQFQNTSEKQKKRTGTIDVNEIDHMRIQIEDNGKVIEACQDPMEKSASVASNKNKPSVDASSSPAGKIRSPKSLKRTHPSSNQEYSKNSMNVLKLLPGTDARLNQELVTTPDKTVIRDMILTEPGIVTGNQNASKVRSESYSRASVQDDNRSPHGLGNGIKDHVDRQSGSLKVGDVERHDDASETSMVDSVVALEITPDDVVGLIGEKQFWKARRAIVNQQRVFAVQVFELHRLIKVQKLIAASPHLLLDDNFYVGRASLKVSPVNKVPSERAIEKSCGIVKPKDHSQKQHASTDSAEEKLVGKLPLPSANEETSKEPISQRSNNGSHSASALPAPMAINAKPSPWCFPPPGNQWLVPVMSPSEGLVYKPYAGPCPPAAGFMAPVYGSCGPISLAPGSGDFLNAAYSVPASDHQGIGILPCTPPFGQTFFQPYGMPVVNPSTCDSAVEQISPLVGSQLKDNQLSVGEVNFTIPHQSSCNMSSQMSRVISCRVGKLQGSKESEVQGSTASSPPERPKGNALPLFPMEPTLQQSYPNAQSNEEQARVIKVVPHNPRSATESAARIFQSIQEERKQL